MPDGDDDEDYWRDVAGRLRAFVREHRLPITQLRLTCDAASDMCFQRMVTDTLYDLVTVAPNSNVRNEHLRRCSPVTTSWSSPPLV